MKTMTGRIKNYDEMGIFPMLFVILSMTSLYYHIYTPEGGLSDG